MSLYKIPLLLTSAICIHKAFTPPTPPPAPEESVKVTATGTEVFTSRLILAISFTAKCFFWFASLSELLLTLALHTPSTPLARALLQLLTGHTHPSAGALAVRLAPLYLLGWACAVGGSLVRILAFRALGRHFTFLITLRKDHALVTSGPYALVRHPSYTGSLLSVCGALVCLLAPGGWLVECAWTRAPAVPWAVGTLVALQALTLAGVLARVPKEDKLLRDTFGQQWYEWAARTPYRLIPGVY